MKKIRFLLMNAALLSMLTFHPFALQKVVNDETETKIYPIPFPTLFDIKGTQNLEVLYSPGGKVIGTIKAWELTSVFKIVSTENKTYYKVLCGNRFCYIDTKYTTRDLSINDYSNEASVDDMYNMIETLSKTDNARIAGTNSEKKAGDFLQTTLESDGFIVQRQWFASWVKNANGTRGGNTQSSNIFAKNPNFNPNYKTVVLMAHYDGVYTPAANDNASGVAMAVELASYLKTRTDLKINVTVLLTGAEEGRHHGSLYYVAHPYVPLSKTELVINLDMVGAGDLYQIFNYTKSAKSGFYPKYAEAIGDKMKLNVIQSYSSYSDHTSFEMQNVPSVTFMNLKDYAFYHTDLDKINKIDKTTLKNISNMTLNLVEEVNRRQK